MKKRAEGRGLFGTFRSAIQGDDGEVDAGYLGLYIVMWLALGSIPMTFILIVLRLILTEDHALDLTGIAAVIGAAGVCFGSAAGGVGIFRAGDKRTAQSNVTTVAPSGAVISTSGSSSGGAAP